MSGGTARRRAVCLAVATLLTAAFALAGPGAAAQPPGVTPTPQAKLTDEQLAQWVLDDPRPRREIIARDAWNLDDGTWNVAALWFDPVAMYTAVKDAVELREKGKPPEWVAQQVSETWHRVVAQLTLPDRYFRGELLGYEQAPELFDALELGHERFLLELAAANEPRGPHSEIRIWNRAVTVLQGTVSAPVLGYSLEGRARAENVLHAVKVAGHSSRDFCSGTCKPTLRYNPKGTSSFDRLSTSITAYATKIDKTGSSTRVGTAVNLSLAKYRSAQNAQRLAQLTEAAAGPDWTHEDKKRLGAEQQAKKEREQAKKGGGCAPAGGAGRIPLAARPGAACRTGGGGLLSAMSASGEPGDYGGVDFSTLQLRYVASGGGADGLRYAFSARRPEVGFRTDPALGATVIRTTGEDLRTWLALDPGAFWVNLNLNEPDRITDPMLGRTNAGRVMLEADLQLKRTAGKLLDPNTPIGRRYWAEMDASSGTCAVSRMWIVPGLVEVSEDDGGLYVLRAALDVKTEAEHPVGAYDEFCGGSAPADEARTEDVERRILLPEIVKAVNTAPEYAALRRTFVTRVVAEWIRGRHAEGRPTPFDDVIGTGDLGPAKLRDGWQPRRVFDAYVRAVHSKEFTFRRTTRQGDTVLLHEYVSGGVDLTATRLSEVDAAARERRFPRLPQTVRTAVDEPARAADGSIWLGGTTIAPEQGVWSQVTDTARGVAASRTGMFVVVVLALGALVFGLRGPRRKAAAGPESSGDGQSTPPGSVSSTQQ
jgi:hypothetical protein